MIIKSDFHMHTNFSTDAEASPKEMIQGAIDKGLDTICITDHQDIEFPRNDGQFRFDTEPYFEVMEQLREEYKDKIDVRIGVEIGLQPWLSAYYKEYINKYPFDFVIGSVHVIGGCDPYDRELFKGKSDAMAYEQTFKETLLDVQAINDYDVLGHIDYVVRYGKSKAQEYSYERFAAEIDDILKYIISQGKGIEINMSGFKYGLGFPHPHPAIIKRYRELGGEIITVGSDGHKPEHIAYEFHKISDILTICGFKYYTEFKNRCPVFRQLP